MAPSPPANKEQLLRRATYDLTGLPPSPQEIDAFLADETPQAFAKVVDRLLASPHYGERWGRFWLDTARYADTTGVRGERGEDYRFPYAWTYRDWVIKAFNSDLPYDQFVMQQLAADKLPNNPPQNLAALGFISVGEKFQNQNDVINDRIDVVSKGFLAMTVSCARCHDHMFDPIPTKDYYAMHGIFASTIEPAEKPIISGPIDPKLTASFQKAIADVEQENRDKYFKLVEDHAFMFRQKAPAYLMAAHLGRRNGSEADQQKADEISLAEKLEQNVLNEVRGRLNRENDIFGPFARFEAAGTDFKDVAAQLSKEKKFNPMIVSALVGSAPKSLEQVAEIYGKVFSSVDTKAKEIFKTYAEAKPSLPAAPAAAKPATATGMKIAPTAIKVTTSAAKPVAAGDPKAGAMAPADASMTAMNGGMMGMMGGGADAKSSAIAGLDQSLVHLAVAPFSIRPAFELSNDSLRREIQRLPLQIQGKGRFDFAKINEILLTHDGSPARAMVVADAPTPHDSPVFVRGQAENHGDLVPRRFLEVLSNGRPQPFKIGSGRLEMAQCIANKNNPLTARVIVNRVWMHHIGQGFVRTPDDLGTQSEAPSHQELLDYLSWYFMEQGWSMKQLHKLIMLSKVYQESSDVTRQEDAIAKDPENRFLWRANVRRLDFEAMRDSLLVMSGRLDRAVGGQPVNLTDEPYSYRRTVYGYIDRGNLPELMSSFDFSNPEMPNSSRTTTIVPQQALFLMNSPMAIDVARRVNARPEVMSAGADFKKVQSIYKVVLQRFPTQLEIQMAMDFITQENKNQVETLTAMKEVSAKAGDLAKKRAVDRAMRSNAEKAIQNEGAVVERRPLTPWETYAQTLLFTNEAAYVN